MVLTPRYSHLKSPDVGFELSALYTMNCLMHVIMAMVQCVSELCAACELTLLCGGTAQVLVLTDFKSYLSLLHRSMVQPIK